MSLKQSEKVRLDDTQVQYGDWDDDGYRKYYIMKFLYWIFGTR